MSDLFSLPFVDDAHGCSREGAEKALPKAGTQMALVYEALQGGPLTDAQLADFLGFAISVVCARRNELVRRGLVTDAGTAWASLACGTRCGKSSACKAHPRFNATHSVRKGWHVGAWTHDF